jgi:gliding motility-associated lipoprotein GldD
MNNIRNITILFLIVTLFLSACANDTLPKPKSYLSLQYPKANYTKLQTNCPYNFEISSAATIEFQNNCWAKIHYPNLKATIHLTYREVDNNLEDVLKEVERLTFEHTVKADVINARPFIDVEKKIYGKIINVEGDVASNIQFHATDSVKNVLFGALYFEVKPNYDSILPAIKYIEMDIKNLMENIEWKNQ